MRFSHLRKTRPRAYVHQTVLHRLRIQALEHRIVPSTLTVTSLLDDGGAGTLRAVIGQANSDAANGVSDAIGFARGLAGNTIGLTQGQLEVTDGAQVTINGNNQITISGNHASRIFQIDRGAQVSLSGLVLTDGYLYPFAGGAIGGGILNYGLLTVNSTTLCDNFADEGGAVYNDYSGTLTICNSALTGNSAGYMASGGGYTTGVGAGVFNLGTLRIMDSTVSGNRSTATGFGGGVEAGGTETIINSTISGNSADQLRAASIRRAEAR